MIMPFFCYNKDDYCDHSENCDGCNVLVKDKGGKEVPSNGDRIRAMTDEELAAVIMCPKENGAQVGTCIGKTCVECCLMWLRQPVEEDTP
jgi:hypothetical protein